MGAELHVWNALAWSGRKGKKKKKNLVLPALHAGRQQAWTFTQAIYRATLGQWQPTQQLTVSPRTPNPTRLGRGGGLQMLAMSWQPSQVWGPDAPSPGNCDKPHG